MVRPQPEPAKRMAYPSAADTYTPGDTGAAPSADKGEGTSFAPRQTETLPSAGGGGGGGGGPLQRLKSPSGMTEREKNTQGLKTWWKSFTQGSGPERNTTERSFRPPTTTMNTRRVFGADLRRVLTFAAMQISTSAPDGTLYVWGEVPIVVGRCGAYLKNKTDIEGIFRVSGSAKRMRELQAVFDEGPKYGIDLEWETSPYTPHDVATIFRRYLTQMPEPVIPHGLYGPFRNVMVSDLNKEQMVREYKRLIRMMPMENQFLLLYILDLLGIFAKDSDLNLMTAPNLAVIFQPGVISHPGHHMRPAESVLSKDVLEFLIEHQSYFVFGMSKRISHSRRQSELSKLAPVEPTTSRKSTAGDSTALAVPDTVPEGASTTATGASASASRSQGPSPTPSASRVRSPRPKPVRADTDFMLPSDSDEEPPEGGYYIVERAQSPRSSIPAREMSSPASAPPRTALQSILPPPRAPRAGRKPRQSEPHQGPGVPAIDIMDPSDSDDDIPSGGYMVYENKPGSGVRRHGSLIRSHSALDKPVKPAGMMGASLSRSRTTALQSAEARANSPKPGAEGGLLSRRKTLPTKRVGDFTARMRRAVRET